jgi:hypothetical protein
MVMFDKIKIEVPRCRFSKYAQSMPPQVRLGGPTAKLQDVLVPLCVSVITCSVEAMYMVVQKRYTCSIVVCMGHDAYRSP